MLIIAPQQERGTCLPAHGAVLPAFPNSHSDLMFDLNARFEIPSKLRE